MECVYKQEKQQNLLNTESKHFRYIHFTIIYISSPPSTWSFPSRCVRTPNARPFFKEASETQPEFWLQRSNYNEVFPRLDPGKRRRDFSGRKVKSEYHSCLYQSQFGRTVKFKIKEIIEIQNWM